MKLVELGAQFVLLDWSPAKGLEDAQGVMFDCPQCSLTHPILAWFAGRGVPKEEVPGPGRWTVSGSSLEDLTLSPSINVSGCWHGWVRNGRVVSA